MKKALIYILSAFAFVSCVDRIVPHGAVGQISVELMTELPVKSATELTSEEASMYRISVLDESGNPAKKESGEEITTIFYKGFQTVTVPLDQEYQVTAESCTIEESERGNGCARYFGNSGLFALNTSNIYQKARITCHQTNALVTVVFDPSLTGRFTDLMVTLTSGSRTLQISESDQVTMTYFTPASLSYTVSGIYTETAYDVDISSLSPVVLEAEDNIRLVIKLDLTHGQSAMPSISVVEEYAAESEEDCIIDPYM